MNDNSRLVYSSEGGRTAQKQPGKKQPAKFPVSSSPGLPNDGVVRIFREKAHRGGKTVTVVRGMPGNAAELKQRATELKNLCGAGGTLREDIIEIQGDHRERIAEKLRSLGYAVKLAGG